MESEVNREQMRALSINHYIDWLSALLKGQAMFSLTFDTTWWKADRRKPLAGHWEGKPYAEGSEWVIGNWQAYGMFRQWVRFINVMVEGLRYKQHWKHSYFGYLLTRENQSRGTVHFHGVIDNWFPWKQANNWWWERCGFIRISPIIRLEGSLAYCLKYCLKSGFQPDIWIPKKRWDGFRLDIDGINRRYQEYMAEPFDMPGEEVPSKEAELGLSDGRVEQHQVKLNLQPDIDRPDLQVSTQNCNLGCVNNPIIDSG